jgi:hypothetical protein
MMISLQRWIRTFAALFVDVSKDKRTDFIRKLG